MTNKCLGSIFCWLKPRRNTSIDFRQSIEMLEMLEMMARLGGAPPRDDLRPHELLCQPSSAELLEGYPSGPELLDHQLPSIVQPDFDALVEQPSSSELLDHQPQLTDLLKNQPTPADLLVSL